MSQPAAPAHAPAVTVLLASRDRLTLLREAVASALAQDHDDFEIVIVDDGSGAETRAWLEGSAATTPRLRVVSTPPRGVAAARATGLATARGEIVCILDSDDLLEPGALRRVTTELASRPDVALVYGNIRLFYGDGSSRLRRYRPFRSARAMALATLVSPRVPFKHSGMTFRRDVAIRLGGYDPSLPSKIDVDLVLRFLRAGERIALLDGPPVVAFRVHAASMSRQRRAGLAAWFRLIDEYGPRNRVTRGALKAIRGSAELLKDLYVRVRRE